MSFIYFLIETSLPKHNLCFLLCRNHYETAKMLKSKLRSSFVLLVHSTAVFKVRIPVFNMDAVLPHNGAP